MRYNLILVNNDVKNAFDAIFVYVSENIDNNIENAFNVIFIYIDEEVNNDIDNVFDATFAYVDKDIANEIKDVFNVKLENNVKDRFVEIVSIHAITNKIENTFVDNVEEVSMLVIINKLYVKLDFMKTIKK